MFKGVFCRNISVEYEYDRCVKMENSGNTAENNKNTLSKFHRDLSPFAEEFVKVCRYKTFWIRISARRTFLLFRCYSIHVKLCVLEVEIEFKRVRAHAAACTAVSPMSGSPTSGTLKKQNAANL